MVGTTLGFQDHKLKSEPAGDQKPAVRVRGCEGVCAGCMVFGPPSIKFIVHPTICKYSIRLLVA